MFVIRFKTTPLKIHDWIILRIPARESARLPSRGMALVEGTINGYRCKIILEPDGKGSHWFKADPILREAAGLEVGTAATVAVETCNKWPEPEIPEDLKRALASDPRANALWMKITPMARWDWLRWIRATNNQGTRIRRIQVALSKLRAGERRPCCFNRNLCTEPEVSKNGVLIEPAKPENK